MRCYAGQLKGTMRALDRLVGKVAIPLQVGGGDGGDIVWEEMTAPIVEEYYVVWEAIGIVSPVVGNTIWEEIKIAV